MKPPNPRVVIQKSSRRDLWIAIAVGALLFAAIVYGVLNLGGDAVSAKIDGTIIEKKFIPQEERQITIGSGGLRTVDKKGTYLIKVRARSDGEIYNVWLDEQTFNALKQGDPYSIPRASVE